VLVVGLGRATRLLGHLALTRKRYEGTIRLGQTTVTDDAEGEVTARTGARNVDPKALAAAMAELTGDIMQVPAAVSAVKIDGKRAYRRVRQGQDVDLPARPVTVFEFSLTQVRETTAPDGTPVTDLDTTVTCSSGTYVRALARDLGAALGTGGHLTALRRLSVGPYQLKDAHTLDELRQRLTILPLDQAAAAAFPRWDVSERQATLLGNGVRVTVPPSLPPGPVAVFGPDGRFIALIEADGERARSLAVFA
jgi:tRNA pseudouridine55 synthase